MKRRSILNDTNNKKVYIIAAAGIIAVVVIIVVILSNIISVRGYFNNTAYKNMESYAKQCSSSIGEMKTAYSNLCKTVAVSSDWETNHSDTIVDMKNIMKNYEVYYCSFIGANGKGFDYRNNSISRRDLPFESSEIPSYKKTYETKAYIGNTGHYEYAIQYPVTSKGKFIGDIYIGLSVTAQFNYLPDSNYNVFVVGKKTGRVIGNSGSAYILGANNHSIYNMVNNISNKDQEFTTSEKKTNAKVKSIMKQDKTIIMPVKDSDPKQICCLTPCGENWYVCVKANLNDINGGKDNIFNLIFRLIALFGALALLVVILFIYYQRKMNKVTIQNEKQLKVANDELNAALEDANRANAAKTTFLSNMSHDIRTPMNAIIGMNQLAIENINDTDKVKEYLEVIKTSSDHLLRLINDVLEVSKIENGKVTLVDDFMELPQVVDNVNRIIRQLCNMKHQEYTFTMSDVRHEFVIGDELRLRQILINLLNNACKFTPENGHIDLTMEELTETDGERIWLRFTVADNGIGMGDEIMKSIFEPFTRENDSAANKIEGTGLGLTIVKSIIDSKGGMIKVDSKQNKGTTFTVDLPFKLAPVDLVKEYYPELQNYRLLMIGGDKNSHEIKDSMDALGIKYYYCESFNDLDQITESKEYNVAVIDEKLSGISSEAISKLRNKLGPEALVLIGGEIAQADDINGTNKEIVCEYNADGFVSKPLSLYEILKSAEIADEDVHGYEHTINFTDKRILLVEDNEINSEIARQILESKGGTVEIAENGKIAVEKYDSMEQGYYDCILMDIQMPVMNGYEATRKIRSSNKPGSKRIPIIAMTANAFAEDVKAALEAGMNAHVAKPIDIDNLIEILNDAINKSGGGSPI